MNLARQSVLVLVLISVCRLANGQAVKTPAERFRSFDRDNNGQVTREEAGNAVWFNLFDRNGDGTITLDEIRRRRGAASASVDQSEQFVSTRDIAYGEHKDQRLDVYAPRESKSSPVMIYVHGGGWTRGDKAAVGQKADYFTKLGWVLVSINYRLLPDGKHPHNVEDVAKAVAWVDDHVAEYGGDAQRIFIMGHSAGAHLVALVATDEQPLKRVGKDLQIIKGVIPLDTQAYDVAKLVKELPAQLYIQVFGQDPASQRDASPMHHIAPGKGIPPFLVCYSRGGARPSPARAAAAREFVAALRKANVPAEVVDASDRDHGAINMRFGAADDDKVTGKAQAFLQDCLRRLKEPVPSGH